MSLITKRYCDLCGMPIVNQEHANAYKVKQYDDPMPDEIRGRWIRIDVHNACLQKLMAGRKEIKDGRV